MIKEPIAEEPQQQIVEVQPVVEVQLLGDYATVQSKLQYYQQMQLLEGNP